jgi:group I intron endonuclease
MISYPKEPGIYCFENKITSSLYVGQSTNLERRIKQHIRDLKANRDYSSILQRAWIKYGEENFEIKILDICTEDKLDEKEIYYIKKMNSLSSSNGYNISSGGGVMRGINSPNYGRKSSEETKEKRKIKRKDYKPSEETKKRTSNSLMRHIVTQETKDKISKSLKGKKANPLTEEHKKKISIANKGRKFGDEFSKKVSYGNLGTKRPNSSSKYKGVSKSTGDNKAWTAQVMINKKNKKIGRFYSEIDAALALINLCGKNIKIYLN